MKTCYFVIGFEGSGTHMLWDALGSVGCKKLGDNDTPNVEIDELITIRRSIPHAGYFPPISTIVMHYEDLGYTVIPTVIIRSFPATFTSVISRDRDRAGKMLDLYHRGRKVLAEALMLPMAFHVCYSDFVNYRNYRKAIFEGHLHLKEPQMGFYNGNDKWYK